MLKRRIFAASLASVLALSSFSVSAFADENEDVASKNVVTKAQLKAYLESDEIKSLYDGDADNYGTAACDNFRKAYDHATAVVNNTDAMTDSNDATVAFQMVKVAKDKLIPHSAEELSSLVEQWQSTRDSENMLYPNTDVNDPKYTSDTWNNFADAFSDAESAMTSTDTRTITDAWENLTNKANDLVPCEAITKAQFRAAYLALIDAQERELKIQPWQRGTIEKNATGTEYDDKTYAWGALYAHINSGFKVITDHYNEFVEVGAFNTTTDEEIVNACLECEKAAKILNAFVPDTFASGTERSIRDLIKKYNGRLAYDYNKDAVTSLAEALQTEVEKVEVGEDKDKNKIYATFSSKQNVDADSKKVLGSYTWKTMKKGTDTIDENGWFRVYSTKTTYKPNGDTEDSKTQYKNTVYKLLTAEFKVKATCDLYFIVDKATGYLYGGTDGKTYDATNTFFTDQATMKTKLDELNKSGTLYEQKKFSKNSEIDIASLVNPFGDSGLTAGTAAYFSDMNGVIDGDSGKAGGTTIDTDPHTNSAGSTELSGGDNTTYQFGGQDPLDPTIFTQGIKGYDAATSGDADTYYIPSNKSGEDATKTAVDTYVDLSLAKFLYDYYVVENAKKEDQDFENPDADNNDAGVNIHNIDVIGTVAAGDAKGSSKEWKLIYNYYKYALEDKYVATVENKTKVDVSKEITNSRGLYDDTGDCALFSYSHELLANNIKYASEWLKAANADSKWKANNKTYPYGLDADGKTVEKADTEAYKSINDAYKQLKKEYDGFKISFEEIHEKIALAADAIEKSGSAETDTLKAAMEDVAYKLLTLPTLKDNNGDDIDTDNVFDESMNFLGYNRVFTNGKILNKLKGEDGSDIIVARSNNNGYNKAHLELQNAYKDLQTAYDALTSPTTTKGDMDKDGKITPDSGG